VKQQALDLRTWGGTRRGAGRKPKGERSMGAHRRRERFRGVRPVHVSLRAAPHVWNLRSERSFTIVHGALADARRRPGFRVVQYAIEGNHLHLVVEADGSSRLSVGVRAIEVRLARRLNRMMGRTGPVFESRFHAHLLRTRAEARNAARYVADNHRNHLARKGIEVPAAAADRYSSEAGRAPKGGQLAFWPDSATAEPRTWLLRNVAGNLTTARLGNRPGPGPVLPVEPGGQ
jgi:REP element-mobilizing transposase RayT